MLPKDTDRIANSVDPDQTALIWVCTVCPDLSENLGSLWYSVLSGSFWSLWNSLSKFDYKNFVAYITTDLADKNDT